MGAPDNLVAADAAVLQSIALGGLPSQLVPCEALGGTVRVQGLSLSRRLALRDTLESEGAGRYVPVLLALCVVDRNGQPLASADDWDAWCGSHAAAMQQLLAVATRLCGFDAGAALGN